MTLYEVPSSKFLRSSGIALIKLLQVLKGTLCQTFIIKIIKTENGFSSFLYFFFFFTFQVAFYFLKLDIAKEV